MNIKFIVKYINRAGDFAEWRPTNLGAFDSKEAAAEASMDWGRDFNGSNPSANIETRIDQVIASS